MRGLEGKSIVVTGAGGGIGRAVSERLGEEGVKLGLWDMNAERVEETAQIVRDAGGEAAAETVDITDEAQVMAAMKSAHDRHGRIDGIHNNAGVLNPGATHEVPVEEWDQVVAINLRGPFLGSKAILPYLLEQGAGAIVNTASIGGLFGVPNGAAYNASKGGVVNYTRQLAVEYGSKGIRANALCPGWTPTGFNDPFLGEASDEEVETMVKASVPLGRQSDPSEMASAVAFLFSDDSSYINGHALIVDGGVTALM
jgi:NAD(P)-dependent dehydrogenase (short-subunit alcohol dehydrogenase family)